MKPIMGSDAETARRLHLALDVPLLRFPALRPSMTATPQQRSN